MRAEAQLVAVDLGRLEESRDALDGPRGREWKVGTQERMDDLVLSGTPSRSVGADEDLPRAGIVQAQAVGADAGGALLRQGTDRGLRGAHPLHHREIGPVRERAAPQGVDGVARDLHRRVERGGRIAADDDDRVVDDGVRGAGVVAVEGGVGALHQVHGQIVGAALG